MLIVPNPLASARRQQGITLIEALIALFIISIGLLGVAGLQATSIAAGHASGQRSLAVFHSAAIAESMRANGSAGTAYDTAVTTPTNANGCSDLASAANNCTPQQMAAEDLYRWREALNADFENLGTANTFGTVTVNANLTPPIATVQIQWTERGTDMSYTSTVTLPPR